MKKPLVTTYGRFAGWIGRQDQYFLAAILSSLASVVVFLALFFFSYTLLPPRIPLFYSQSWGQPELALKSQFLILPAVVVITGLVNTTLAWQLHPSQNVLKRILLLATILINLIILITATKVVLIFA